jgi:hypothetical protein
MSQAHEVQQHLDEVKSLRERLGTGQWQEEDWGILEPTFKGGWSAAANFVPLPPLDTRPGRYPQHHR